jgi:DNA-binding GntR family transcriptional regulator
MHAVSKPWAIRLLRYQHTTLSVPCRWERSLDEHAELVDAIAPRDSERARRKDLSWLRPRRRLGVA